VEAADFSQPQAQLSSSSWRRAEGQEQGFPSTHAKREAPKPILQLTSTHQKLLGKPKLSLNVGTATRQGSHYLQQPHAERGGRAGLFMTHHLWNSLLSVPQPLLRTMPEPLLKSCMTYQLPRANQHGIYHPERRQDQQAADEWTDAAQSSLW